MSLHHVPKDDAWKQAHLAMLVELGKRAWLHCDDCRHSVMIRAARARPTASARHADAAAHDLKGDALHALWGAEGMLLAGACMIRGAGVNSRKAPRWVLGHHARGAARCAAAP
jgi:hypothetical protein